MKWKERVRGNGDMIVVSFRMIASVSTCMTVIWTDKILHTPQMAILISGLREGGFVGLWMLIYAWQLVWKNHFSALTVSLSRIGAFS